MKKVSRKHPAFRENAEPFYQIIMEGLKGEVEGEHFWDAVDENAVFELDFEDSMRRRQQLARYARDVLTRRFDQEAIYIKFVGPVDALAVEKVVVRRQRKRQRDG